MNKREAKRRAEEFTGTIADLLALSEADKRPDEGPSILNAGMNHGQAKAIMLAGIAGRSPDEKVAIWKPDPYSRTGKMCRTGDALIVQNFYREFA